MGNKKHTWTEADVRCPFFSNFLSKANSVTCEGFDEGVFVNVRFTSLEQRERHMGAYCVDDYRRCPMFRCTYDEKYSD